MNDLEYFRAVLYFRIQSFLSNARRLKESLPEYFKELDVELKRRLWHTAVTPESGRISRALGNLPSRKHSMTFINQPKLDHSCTIADSREPFSAGEYTANSDACAKADSKPFPTIHCDDAFG